MAVELKRGDKDLAKRRTVNWASTAIYRNRVAPVGKIRRKNSAQISILLM
jgi:hypothetical protein